MKEWPLYLFIFGVLAITIAAIFDSSKIMICTVIGYISGFITGLLFGVDGVDQGGGTANNTWVIWTLSYLFFIAAGAAWELVNKYKNRNLK